MIGSGQLHFDLGVFELQESAQQLEEVVINAEKSTFNNTIDRKIFNIGQDLMSKAGSLSDLLQNIPSIVDVEGNVSLRGSENVLILINGKPSLLMERTGLPFCNKCLLIQLSEFKL